jgi:CelD/BcsL family acetyltransferase involved in cellulose biosynthesis
LPTPAYQPTIAPVAAVPLSIHAPAPLAVPQTHSAPLAVQAVRSEQAFAQLAAEWNRIHEAAAAASPFNAWAWQFEWWRVYGKERRLHILTARRDGELCGVLPLYVETQKTLGLPVRVARLLGSGGDTYPDDLGPIFAPECESEAREALIAAALGSSEWDVLSLEDMDSRLPFGQLVADAAHRRVSRIGHEPIAYIDLPATWEAYLASLSRNRRSKLRSQRKKLHRETAARFHVWTDPAGIDGAFDRFVALHHKRWRSTGQESESFQTAQYLDFHRSIMRSALRRGALRLYALDIDGAPAAMLYALRFRKSVFIVQSGFDPELSRLRPGLVLLGHAIQHAIEEGNEVFDFLRGEHSYKDHLAAGERETEIVTAARGTLAGRVWHLRHVAVRALKERLRPYARLVGLAK